MRKKARIQQKSVTKKLFCFRFRYILQKLRKIKRKKLKKPREYNKIIVYIFEWIVCASHREHSKWRPVSLGDSMCRTHVRPVLRPALAEENRFCCLSSTKWILVEILKLQMSHISIIMFINSSKRSMHTRVQWFLLFFTFWGITTHPWHPKGPRIWKLAKKKF